MLNMTICFALWGAMVRQCVYQVPGSPIVGWLVLVQLFPAIC